MVKISVQSELLPQKKLRKGKNKPAKSLIYIEASLNTRDNTHTPGGKT